MEVVRVVEEIQEIHRVPRLAEEVPFVTEEFRARLVARESGGGDGGPEVDFIYDAEVDREEIDRGE